MSDGAGAGAVPAGPSQGSVTTTNGKGPGPAPAPKPSTGTPAPAKGTPSVAKPASAPKEPSQTESATPGDDAWDDTRDRGELERLIKKFSKHEPKARVRVRGEEKGIESLDDLFGVITDAQRGRGAHRLVEEANKQKAEAEKVLQLRERASQGDLAALQELAGDGALKGLDQMRARSQEAEQLRSQMSDVERTLFDELQNTRSMLQQREAMDAQLKQEREATAQKQRLESTRAEAQGMAKSILEGLKLPPEKLDVAGPFVVRAMREAIELGLQLGKDVPPEAILKRAQQEMQGVVSSALDGLQPDQLADFLGPDRVRALAKVFYTRLRGQPQQAQQQASGQRREEKPAEDFGTPGYLFNRNIPR